MTVTATSAVTGAAAWTSSPSSTSSAVGDARR